MKTVFNMENPFFSFMGRLADYVILNLLFLLTACPVITVGTALRAMHEVLPRMAQGTEGSLYRTYMQAYIRNFRRTVPVWILLLLSGTVLVFDVTIAADSLSEGLLRIAMPVVGCLLVLWLLVFSWIFLPESGRTEETETRALNAKSAEAGSAGERPAGTGAEEARPVRGKPAGVRDMLRAALFEAVRNLPRSLFMILIEVLPAACYIFFTRIFLGIVLPFYVCIGFSLSGALCSILAGRTRLRRERIQDL